MIDTIELPAWSLQDAKARFSELVRRCDSEGPQQITKHGEPEAVLVPWDWFRSMTARKMSLADFFASAPRAVLDTARSAERERELDF